jgi:thymidine kinase
MGSLHVILGPMFSGKTTRLIQIYKTKTYIMKRVAVINYTDDMRYSSRMLSTHDLAMIPCIQLRELSNFDCSQFDTILINEGQFFSDLMPNVLNFVENFDKEVFVFGLDGDFLRNKFGNIIDLIPFCNTVEKLSALCANCRDGTFAHFSHRTSQEVEQLVIGGADNYKPLCRKCYMNR